MDALETKMDVDNLDMFLVAMGTDHSINISQESHDEQSSTE